MLRFQLSRSRTDGTVLHGYVELTDDARGADEYLKLRRRGFQLRRLPEAEAE